MLEEKRSMEEYRLMIRDVPEEERPRERMKIYGAENLTNTELLAILLRTGVKGQSVIHLADYILHKAGSLKNLLEMDLEELKSIKGVGEAKAIQVKAGLELGRRLSRRSLLDKYQIRSPKDAADYMMDSLRYLHQEHFVCLFLNTKNQVIGQETIFIGTLNSSIVHPREVFREGIRRSAASIILLHNHPSGDPTPSKEDLEVTKRLVESGRLLGIEVLDHLIIGDGTFVSLKEKGYM
jgi:DNA repair protein RadC